MKRLRTLFDAKLWKFLLVGMVLFTGLNYLGQRFFAFRSPKTEEK